ncbi:hypothetical protein ACG873_08230 [Mesorhizobium sp. AaZ16]|uniref:hypothetical protein n=1 Tax=Mesorhizobium sp. AaZ16 TaxID=3402289 RepID=UPI00374F7E46
MDDHRDPQVMRTRANKRPMLEAVSELLSALLHIKQGETGANLHKNTPSRALKRQKNHSNNRWICELYGRRCDDHHVGESLNQKGCFDIKLLRACV